MVTSRGHIRGRHSASISCRKRSALSSNNGESYLCSFKWEVGSAVLDEVGDCGTNAVGKFDQTQRLQVGVEESLIEEVERSPLEHKIFPPQQVSLLQQRVDGSRHMIYHKRLQTCRNCLTFSPRHLNHSPGLVTKLMSVLMRMMWSALGNFIP